MEARDFKKAGELEASRNAKIDGLCLGYGDAHDLAERVRARYGYTGSSADLAALEAGPDPAEAALYGGSQAPNASVPLLSGTRSSFASSPRSACSSPISFLRTAIFASIAAVRSFLLLVGIFPHSFRRPGRPGPVPLSWQHGAAAAGR